VGVTSTNTLGTKNDIDILGAQFYNFDERYYKESEGLLGNDYFEAEKLRQIRSLKMNEGSEIVETLETTAMDLLSIKRLREEQDKKDILRDLSNILKDDSSEQILFKMFEQVKNFNNMVDDMQNQQKEI